jgi:pimeloyl-ACP methyl ester carboxylesterase
MVRPGRLVDVGTHHVRVYEAGAGAPTVVLAPGAGDCAASWIHVQQEVAQFTHVLSYDRAGIGGSETGPPATLDRCLNDVFTQRHRAEVAGLLLVDATPEAVVDDAGVRAGLGAAAVAARALGAASLVGVTRLLLETGTMPLYPEQPRFRTVIAPEDYRRWVADVCHSFADGAAADELRRTVQAAEQAKKLREGISDPQFGDLPLGVLTSLAFGDKWIQWHREMAARSTNSFHRITDAKAHNIHLRNPDMVTDAIRQLVNVVRERKL